MSKSPISGNSRNNSREAFFVAKPQHIACLFWAVLFSLGLLFLAGGTASAHTAHAKVLSATPAIGSTITKVPTTVTVETAENINPDPKKSNLFVYGPSGDLISQGDAKVNLNKPTEMSVAIKDDGKGVYVVHWITVSAVDGDPDDGAFVFTVNPSRATSSTSAQNTNTATPSTSNTTPIWVAILVGVLALLIGLGGGFGIGRGRSKAASSSIGAMRKSLSEEKEPTKTP